MDIYLIHIAILEAPCTEVSILASFLLFSCKDGNKIFARFSSPLRMYNYSVSNTEPL